MMPKSIADGVGRVFTPPWNKKRLPPNSPHGVRHAAAVHAAVAAEKNSPQSSARIRDQLKQSDEDESRSPLSPQRDIGERGLAHSADIAAARGHMHKAYPIVSLSTQMAQVRDCFAAAR